VNTSFLYMLNLFSSLWLLDQVSHVHKITGEFIGLYSLIFPTLNLLLKLVLECTFDLLLPFPHISTLLYFLIIYILLYVEYLEFSMLFSGILTLHVLCFLYIHF
jgi:hypothetical protein